MIRKQFSITTFAPLIIGLAFLNSHVRAQTASSTAVVQSGEETPKLKLRQPAPDPGSPSIRDRQPSIRDERRNSATSPNVTDESKVRFEGLHAFTEEQVLKLFRERRVWVQTDQMAPSQVLARACSVLRESLVAGGYVQASVEGLQDEETGAIVLWVLEGPRFSIVEIRFEGNRIFPSEELAARMRGLLQHYEESTKDYDAEIFNVCLRQLSNFIRSSGYLKARLGEPKKELVGAGLVVTVPVEEGALYRLGEIKIEGAENVSQEQIRAMLGLKRNDIANGEAIGKWLYEDLKNLYGEMGYIQYTAEPVPDFRLVDHASNEGAVDFTVSIEEGRQFRIRSIKFGGSNGSEKELRNLLLIRAGDVFNQQLFEKSVNELNKTGWFEAIDKDKDADFRTDEEEALLNITLRLKRRERL